MTPLKTVYAPHLGRNVKFGRRQPAAFAPHLKLRNYLKASLPVAPATDDYSSAAQSVLRDVMLNDRYGDCVIAAGYHTVGVETGNAGNLFHANSTQIVADYSKIGGFDPNNPDATDNGCNLQDALNYWTSHGFANGTKLLGWLGVDATNPTEIMACCYLFENLYLGMGLPDAWINPFPSGDDFVWDAAGSQNPNNGHCVSAGGYDSKKGIRTYTWGLEGWLTFRALAEYAVNANGGELYVMLTPDQLAKGAQKAPNGVAWGALISDFDSIGGHVPVPAPAPTPPPAPSTGGVSLAQAEAAIKTAFAKSPWLISAGSAATTAMHALENLSGWPK